MLITLHHIISVINAAKYYYTHLAKLPLTGADIERSMSLLDREVLAEAEDDPEIKAWSTHAIKFLRPNEFKCYSLCL